MLPSRPAGGWPTEDPLHNHIDRLLAAVAAAALLGGCGGSQQPGENVAGRGPEARVVSVYNRAAYAAGQAAADFSSRTGIKVVYASYDSAPVHEIKLLVGKSGYDVVVTPASLLGRLAGSGVFLELDRERLPNLANMDPRIMERIAAHDPGNRHAVPYLWGTTGLAYNPERVLEALGMARIDSWSALFRADDAAKLRGCGVGVADVAEDAMAAALIYLGRDPNDGNAEDLAAAEQLWLQARPNLRFLEPAQLVDELARGTLCVALARNGDAVAARARGAEASPPVDVAFAIPAEGASVWFDVLAIPLDAPHPDNAHAYINYLMDPQVIATVTGRVRYANANAASYAKLDAAVRDDSVVYPHPEAVNRLHPELAQSPEYSRLLEESWERIRAKP